MSCVRETMMREGRAWCRIAVYDEGVILRAGVDDDADEHGNAAINIDAPTLAEVRESATKMLAALTALTDGLTSPPEDADVA